MGIMDLELVSRGVEINWFATPGVTHFVQNCGLPGVGVADDQNPKALEALVKH